jgi:hypothetical protein
MPYARHQRRRTCKRGVCHRAITSSWRTCCCALNTTRRHSQMAAYSPKKTGSAHNSSAYPSMLDTRECRSTSTCAGTVHAHKSPCTAVADINRSSHSAPPLSVEQHEPRRGQDQSLKDAKLCVRQKYVRIRRAGWAACMQKAERRRWPHLAKKTTLTRTRRTALLRWGADYRRR